MRHLFLVPLAATLCQLGAFHALAAESSASPSSETRMPLAMGSAGGVYLLAEPGELTIDIYKRDRNRRAPAVLRAVLAGPDRRVVQEATIPDDGQPRGSGLGPVQRTQLSTHAANKGVYALNITVSQDRYGDEALWGFATNCKRYLIETSRGHRDARHEEPIVLDNPQVPGDVCFLPRPGEFSVDVTGLPRTVDALTMFDGQGQVVRQMPVDVEGRVMEAFDSESPPTGRPWRLHLPSQQATVHIDGLTRWDSRDRYPDLSLWTDDARAFFPLADYRWLLTPYSRLIYADSGSSGEVTFRLHNNSGGKRTVQLSCEFPDGRWPVEFSPSEVTLRSKQSAEVTVRYRSGEDGESRICHLRATPREDPEFSTYSTLEVRTGKSPGSAPLAMPLVLKPYQHENEQFGYVPDYPADNQVYFDLDNRPYVCTDGGVMTRREDTWIETSLQTASPSAADGGQHVRYQSACTKLAFDADNDLYALGRTGQRAALLRSTDGGRSFSAYEIPARADGSGALDFEQFSGHNVPEGPPPVLRYTRTASDPRLFWRRLHDLELFVPRKTENGVVIGEPILISRKCIGLAAHSGIPSTVVSREGTVHVVWGEATEPEEDVPGVPTYVATYDCRRGKLSEPALVGYGAPANDIHNTPSITMDSHGYLHVLAGTHGRPFQYARSLQPNDAAGGWTSAVPVGKDLPQTYIGLVCGPDDTLHLIYRLWKYGQPPHPDSHHATLAWQRKRPERVTVHTPGSGSFFGENSQPFADTLTPKNVPAPLSQSKQCSSCEWSPGQPWEDPQVLIVPPFSEYSVFYHRLTIDRQGRLFLSYDYWSTFWFYRTDHWGRRRSLIMSPDGGETWKLVETADFGKS